MIYRFKEFTLDVGNAQLRRADAGIDTEPQVIALLIYLAENRDRVISKDELIDVVWNGRIVSDATLNSRISSARRAVGDTGKNQTIIRTYSKQGYQFVAELESNSAPPKSTEKPSIAVLPFDDLSDDPSEEYFADGITEDLITGLSAYHALRIIARSSSFTFKHQSKSIQKIGAALNVQYLVEGSVRKSGDQIRITARLVEAASGSEIWSQRYDREFKDIFAIQDEVTNSVAAILPARLQAADLVRAKRKNTGNMLAYDYLLRGVDHYHKITPENNAQAIALLEKAIMLDPNYAQAFAWLACVLGQGKYQGYFEEDIDEQALELIKKAGELDGNDSEVFRILAAIETNMGEQTQADISLERAIALNPNDPRVLCQKSEQLILGSQPGEGLLWLDAVKNRDPMIGETWWRIFGRAKFELKDYEAAFEALGRVRNFRLIDRACLAASFAFVERMTDAKLAVADIIRIEPEFSITEFVKTQPYSFEKSRKHLADGLRKAGLS